MRTVLRTSLTAAAVTAVVMLLGARAATQGTPAGEPLTAAVASFLEVWLAQQNPRAAIERHLSPRAIDPRLIPAESFAPAEYRKLVAGGGDFKVTRASASEQFSRAMTRWSVPRPALAQKRVERLAPIDRETMPELWSALAELAVEPRLLREVPALAYRLKDFSSYEWVAPVTIGYRTLVPDMIAKGLHVEGVVSRVRVPENGKTWMLFMFWANERSAKGDDWRVLGLAPVPTE